MKQFIIISIITFLMTDAFAQKENYDMASFVAPKGWQRVDSNGVLMFQQEKTVNGLTSFGQIFLCHAQASSGSAESDFNNGWNERIVKYMGTTAKPTPQVEKTPDGWTVTTGYTNITKDGFTFTCMLVSMTGYNKTMQFIVNFAGQDFTDDVQVFFKGMDLRKEYVVGNLWNGNDKAPESNTGTGSAIAPASLSDYQYTPPPGWTTAKYSDGIVLSSPEFTGGERCILSLWPTRPASADLQTDAWNTFKDIFKAYQLRNDGMFSGRLVKGQSPMGWEYFIIKRDIGIPGQATVFGFVFVAKLGNMLAPISGVSKDPLVSNCFGELINDVWPNFFYSLSFKNWKGELQEQAYRKKMAGEWISASATAGTVYTFAANGRYDDAAAATQYTRISSSEVMTTTQTYFGDGAYKLKGYEITLIRDNKKDQAERGLIRLEQVSKDDGQTWKEMLYLRRVSKIDGKEYEVGYNRAQ